MQRSHLRLCSDFLCEAAGEPRGLVDEMAHGNLRGRKYSRQKKRRSDEKFLSQSAVIIEGNRTDFFTKKLNRDKELP